MRFHEYETVMVGLRRVTRHTRTSPPTTQDLDEVMDSLRYKMEPSSYAMMHLHREWDKSWAADRKPYYSVYPSLIPMLTKLQLDKVRGSDIRLPHGLKSLSVRFPVGQELGGEVRTIWINELDSIRRSEDGVICRGLSLGIDQGEVSNGVPVYLIRSFPLVEDSTVEESLEALPKSWTASEGKQLDPKSIIESVRLVCTLCLIGDSPELLEPEVLSKDKHRVSQDNIEKLVAKAKRRGKLGWSLGRSIETIPHYRRPHPALVWTGVGRKVPKIILRSGSVVHREVVAAVPTGYLDNGAEPPE